MGIREVVDRLNTSIMENEAAVVNKCADKLKIMYADLVGSFSKAVVGEEYKSKYSIGDARDCINELNVLAQKYNIPEVVFNSPKEVIDRIVEYGRSFLK